MKEFEDKFMDIQAGMISLCLEYVGGQADKVYIYGIAEDFYEFNVFYKIGKHYSRKHLVNDYIPESSHVDIGLQRSLLKYGIEYTRKIVELCKEYNREHPTEMWLIYDVQKNSLDSRYSYEGRYDKDEELIPRLEFDKWFEEVKQQEG